MPAIELLKSKLEVISVDNGTDYRHRTLEQISTYHCPLGPTADAAMTEAFERLAESQDEDPVLRIEHREVPARRRAGGVVWFDFKTLCGGPRSQNDYLELASQFHTVLLSGRAADAASPGFGSAPLHLAGGRALRSARQADPVGGSAA